MARKRQTKKPQPQSTPEASQAEDTTAPSPFLDVAHPPAKSLTLMTISVILFAVWFLFLLMAAFSS